MGGIKIVLRYFVYTLIKQKYEELYQENIELLQTIEDIERLIKHLYDQKKNKC